MSATRNRSVSASNSQSKHAIAFIDMIMQRANEQKGEAQIGDLDSNTEYVYSEAWKGNAFPLLAKTIESAQDGILTFAINEFFTSLQDKKFYGKVGMSWKDYLRPQIVCLVNSGDWDTECVIYEIDAEVNAKLTSYGMKLDTIVLEAPSQATLPDEFQEILLDAHL